MIGDGKGEIERSEETKVKDGDILKMKVWQEKGEIEWLINGEQEYSYSMPRIKDTTIQWVPFVRVFHTNTQFEWVE